MASVPSANAPQMVRRMQFEMGEVYNSPQLHRDPFSVIFGEYQKFSGANFMKTIKGKMDMTQKGAHVLYAGYPNPTNPTYENRVSNQELPHEILVAASDVLAQITKKSTQSQVADCAADLAAAMERAKYVQALSILESPINIGGNMGPTPFFGSNQFSSSTINFRNSFNAIMARDTTGGRDWAPMTRKGLLAITNFQENDGVFTKFDAPMINTKHDGQSCVIMSNTGYASFITNNDKLENQDYFGKPVIEKYGSVRYVDFAGLEIVVVPEAWMKEFRTYTTDSTNDTTLAGGGADNAAFPVKTELVDDINFGLDAADAAFTVTGSAFTAVDNLSVAYVVNKKAIDIRSAVELAHMQSSLALEINRQMPAAYSQFALAGLKCLDKAFIRVFYSDSPKQALA